MDEAEMAATAQRERGKLNAMGYDMPLRGPERCGGPMQELKAMLADRLVYWAFCLDRERFRVQR